VEQQLAAAKLADRAWAAIGQVGEDDIGEGLADLKFHGDVGFSDHLLRA